MGEVVTPENRTDDTTTTEQPQLDGPPELADVLAAAQAMVHAWQFALDGFDGMISQAVDRGWTREQARELVLGSLPRGPRS